MPRSMHAEKLLHPLRAREELSGRALVNDPAAVEDDDVLCDALDDAEVLLHEQDRGQLRGALERHRDVRDERGARPFVGSSTRSSALSFRSARAIATICCCPPESVPARCPPRSPSSGKSS